jgi:hypothetical protein
MTATNFGKNRTGNPAGGGPSAKYTVGTSLNSSPASFCRLSKNAKRSISGMIVVAKWPGRGVGRLGKQSAVLSRQTRCLP